jgi:predicted MFS family arabinose efflux permease
MNIKPIPLFQGLVKNYTGLMIARAFLGIAEGGLFPGIAFYITVSSINYHG